MLVLGNEESCFACCFVPAAPSTPSPPSLPLFVQLIAAGGDCWRGDRGEEKSIGKGKQGSARASIGEEASTDKKTHTVKAQPECRMSERSRTDRDEKLDLITK